MRFNLHITYWSLLIITLISSCFLFYVVASENAKYTITEPTNDASVASDSQTPPQPSMSATTSNLDKNAEKNSEASVFPNVDGDYGKDQIESVDKVLPNYKKLKKSISEQQPTPLTIDNSGSDSPVSSPSAAKIVEVSDASNEIINSSDSVVLGDSENIGDSVENKNLFNTIDAYTENIHEHNKIHSSYEKPTEEKTQKQVPDVEHQAHQGITQHHVQDDNTDTLNGLPDIKDIPTVTVTELPLEVLQQPQNTLNSVIIDDGGDRSKEEKVNGSTMETITETEENIQKDDQIVKINDSGGGEDVTIQPSATITLSTAGDDLEVPLAANNIPIDTNNINTTQPSINISLEQQQRQENTSSTTTASQVNLTAAEEVPMPVFSEWTQKQMEAAEKQQALEQELTVNNSAQRKNYTNGNGKPASLKIRAKNYASPDCGAKIIASSAYTSNAGAVLSSSKDEYMLSLRGNRIWFVVELCEAVQAQKIDFGNFELYSSSPQNFTVAVSKRFPTREWLNVGRFEAEDKRAVQSFDLHPHLFGKFVRVDINSHYSKEHYCTLSLFRVFGTSEFEAFETENHPNDYLDDFYDDYLLEQNPVKHPESNLFKSASDAVLSIVKKATEVLGKPANNQNLTFKTQPQSVVCRTPIYGLFSCSECPATLVDKVNNILTCEFSQLNSLLSNRGIRNDLLNTRVCDKLYGIETEHVLVLQKDIKRSFYINMLPNEYVGAMCQALARPKTVNKKPNDTLVDEGKQHDEATDFPTNLTIDKKFGKEDLNLLDHPEKKLMKPEITTLPVEQMKPNPEVVETTTDINLDDKHQLPRPLEPEDLLEATTLPPIIIQKPNLPDTNIFNVPADELSSEMEVPVAVTEIPNASVENLEPAAPLAVPSTTATITPTLAPNVESLTASSKSEEDTNSWDNIEHLLTTVPTTITTGNTGSSGQYNQQKTSNSAQSESVFIRLSNRIKALERNMSLSGQYLEELSRRYKKQVEELQLSLTQQVQIVRTLEEENRRHHELEKLYALRNTQLKDELDDLTLQVHACIVVIIFVGAFVFMVLMVAILFYRTLRKETKEVLSLYDKTTKKRNDATISTTNLQKKINRRKSFEDFSDHQQSIKSRDQKTSNVSSSSYSDKLRRPSEEVTLILKDCKSDCTKVHQQYEHETEQPEEMVVANHNNAQTTRQRKISVCYGSSNNINQSNNQFSALPPQHPQKSQIKRKGEKHSWPNTAHAQLQAWQHFEELNADDQLEDSSLLRTRKLSTSNGKSKKKKETQSLRRQQSSPDKSSTPVSTALKGAEFDERLMLDEDDLDNFIPNSDLAYNEFMPDGPRGYQCANTNSNANNPASKKIPNKQLDNNLKKSRRLSSPVFFKSPFTKSLKVGDLSKT